MQKSYKKIQKVRYRNELPATTTPCPRCGRLEARLSSKKLKDGLLKILFCNFYRCYECRYRFWITSPTRIFLFIGLLLVLIPMGGVIWRLANQRPTQAATIAKEFTDPIKSKAEQGDAEAQLQMGLRYASTAWGMENDKIATQWFAKAAAQNQVEAQYRYGMSLLKGIGVVQDYKMAFAWLEKSAKQGYAQAQFAVGKMYQAGIGIDSNAERAYLWFNLAASQGLETATSARELVIKLLTPQQIIAVQEEAIRMSHGTSPAIESQKADANKPSLQVATPAIKEPNK